MQYDFVVGKLVKVHNGFFNRCILHILSDENIVKIKTGKAMAKDLVVGEDYSIGYIGNKLVNIRKGIYFEE